MAVTAIWNVKGRIDKALSYVENPDKTINPEILDAAQLTSEASESIGNVISYIKRESPDNSDTASVQFVTGINVSTEETLMEMMAVKKAFGKMGGNTAFHAYQSFAPGEATPEIAHEIGTALAKEIWGERFQVVVATHIDKMHLHNHFLINSVSFKDGKKYYDSKRTYRLIREASDRLCKEHGLSVIKTTEKSGKDYSEWNDERAGKPTWRSIIKKDVDEAIVTSMSDREFFNRLKEQGYEIKNGKDISVKPPGKERLMRLARNFGENYTIENIRKRILSQDEPEPAFKETPLNNVIPKTVSLPAPPQFRITGYFGLYIRYYHKLSCSRGKSKGRNARMHFLLREDLSKLDKIYSEMTLLRENKIENKEQLFSYKESTNMKISELTEDRQALRKKVRHVSETENSGELKTEIADISMSIKLLRQEVRRCDSILDRSEIIKEKMKAISTEKADKEKEVSKDGQFRGNR